MALESDANTAVVVASEEMVTNTLESEISNTSNLPEETTNKSSVLKQEQCSDCGHEQHAMPTLAPTTLSTLTATQAVTDDITAESTSNNLLFVCDDLGDKSKNNVGGGSKSTFGSGIRWEQESEPSGGNNKREYNAPSTDTPPTPSLRSPPLQSSLLGSPSSSSSSTAANTPLPSDVNSSSSEEVLDAVDHLVDPLLQLLPKYYLSEDLNECDFPEIPEQLKFSSISVDVQQEIIPVNQKSGVCETIENTVTVTVTATDGTNESLKNSLLCIKEGKQDIMTVITPQNSGENLREIILVNSSQKPENVTIDSVAENDSDVPVESGKVQTVIPPAENSYQNYAKSLNEIPQNINMPNKFEITTETSVNPSIARMTSGSAAAGNSESAMSAKIRRQRFKNAEEKSEDPIERLNRLRAKISGALSEVKGVLKQYSTEQSVDNDDGNSGSAAVGSNELTQTAKTSESLDDAPIRFRFVRKIRRRSHFSEDDKSSSPPSPLSVQPTAELQSEGKERVDLEANITITTETESEETRSKAEEANLWMRKSESENAGSLSFLMPPINEESKTLENEVTDTAAKCEASPEEITQIDQNSAASLSKIQPEATELSVTAPHSSDGIKHKKKIIVKRKTVRSASIAAVESSRIEPPIKAALPLNLKAQRRPSDSEAIVKKKTSAATTNEEATSTLKTKNITKVKRPSVKSRAVVGAAAASMTIATTTPATTTTTIAVANNSTKNVASKATTTTTTTTIINDATKDSTDKETASKVHAKKPIDEEASPSADSNQTSQATTHSIVTSGAYQTLKAEPSVVAVDSEKPSPATLPIINNDEISTEAETIARKINKVAVSSFIPESSEEIHILQAATAAAATTTSVIGPVRLSTKSGQLQTNQSEPSSSIAKEQFSEADTSTEQNLTDAKDLQSAAKPDQISKKVESDKILKKAASFDAPSGVITSAQNIIPNSSVAPATLPSKALPPLQSGTTTAKLVAKMPDQRQQQAPVQVFSEPKLKHVSLLKPFNNLKKDNFATKKPIVVKPKLIKANSTEKTHTSTPAKGADKKETSNSTSVIVKTDDLTEKNDGKVDVPTEGASIDPEGNACDETKPATEATPPKPAKKERKIKKKVIIRRLKRKLSTGDPFFKAPDEDQPETEIVEKPIEYVDENSENDEFDDVCEEEEEDPTTRPKPWKSCLKPRQFEIGDLVMYAERFKKTQVRWKKATVLERITSISYKLDINGEEKPAHISYIKKFTDRKVNFGGKEYLEIDYEQIAEEEEKARNYSIWNMV